MSQLSNPQMADVQLGDQDDQKRQYYYYFFLMHKWLRSLCRLAVCHGHLVSHRLSWWKVHCLLWKSWTAPPKSSYSFVLVFDSTELAYYSAIRCPSSKQTISSCSFDLFRRCSLYKVILTSVNYLEELIESFILKSCLACCFKNWLAWFASCYHKGFRSLIGSLDLLAVRK